MGPDYLSFGSAKRTGKATQHVGDGPETQQRLCKLTDGHDKLPTQYNSDVPQCKFRKRVHTQTHRSPNSCLWSSVCPKLSIIYSLFPLSTQNTPETFGPDRKKVLSISFSHHFKKYLHKKASRLWTRSFADEPRVSPGASRSEADPPYMSANSSPEHENAWTPWGLVCRKQQHKSISVLLEVRDGLARSGLHADAFGFPSHMELQSGAVNLHGERLPLDPEAHKRSSVSIKRTQLQLY